MSRPQDYIDEEIDLDQVLKKLNFIPLKLDNNFMNGAKTLIDKGFVQTELFTRPNETGKPVAWALFVKEEIAGNFIKNMLDEFKQEILDEINELRKMIKSSRKVKGVKF